MDGRRVWVQSSETRRQRKDFVEQGRYWLAMRISTAIRSTKSKTLEVANGLWRLAEDKGG
jgi:hypothetical protein